MVCDILLDGRDAQSIHIQEVFKNLAKLSDIHLLAPAPLQNMHEVQNIIFVPSIMPLFKSAFYQIFLFLYLSYYCFKLAPDVIYSRYSDLAFSSVLVSKFFRIPYVIEVNGLIIDEMKMFNRPKRYIKFAKRSEKLNYKHAKKIVAVTPGVKEGIKELYNIPDGMIVVIENGANTDLFTPLDRKEVKKELNLDQNANYICFVGALAQWQGVEYIIKSAPLILKECPNTNFLIVGEGPMKKALVELAGETGVSDEFIFTGIVPYEEVSKYISASDICVVPKRPLKSGYSPLKLYEYMACGKPVVASRVEGFTILEQKNAGILVEPENPENIANVIIKLLNNEKLREELGRNGREYVVKNHSWANVAKIVAEVCEDAVRNKK